MLSLSRTVRFALNPPGLRQPGVNGYAGNPPARGLARHYEFEIRCTGTPDPRTGYLIDIKDIDRAVRDRLFPIVEQACDRDPSTEPASIIPALTAALAAAIGPSLAMLRWRLTPYYSVEMSPADSTTVLLRQKFDFSASHRLHIPTLSDDENRRLFGKCNHPGGHGHNYQFEPCIALRVETTTAGRGGGGGGGGFTIDTLERLADETILRRFDHKNLTTDCPEFRVGPNDRGVNATVESIAKVFHTLLAPAVAAQGATLRSITVWETDRTSATYPA